MPYNPRYSLCNSVGISRVAGSSSEQEMADPEGMELSTQNEVCLNVHTVEPPITAPPRKGQQLTGPLFCIFVPFLPPRRGQPLSRRQTGWCPFLVGFMQYWIFSDMVWGSSLKLYPKWRVS